MTPEKPVGQLIPIIS